MAVPANQYWVYLLINLPLRLHPENANTELQKIIKKIIEKHNKIYGIVVIKICLEFINQLIKKGYYHCLKPH